MQVASYFEQLLINPQKVLVITRAGHTPLHKFFALCLASLKACEST